MLTATYLRSILSYNPATGEFHWKVRRRCFGGGTQIGRFGRLAGFNLDGYIYIGIEGNKYAAQKLAWLYMTGEWPKHIVDHKNRKRNDNCWDNLRPATWVQNCQNKEIRSDNASGVTGVSFDASRNKWTVRLKIDGRYRYFGRYDAKEDAIAARKQAEATYFGEFAPMAA